MQTSTVLFSSSIIEKSGSQKNLAKKALLHISLLINAC